MPVTGVNRPALTPSLSEREFVRWYWLKRELVDFCRAQGVPAGGSKQAVAERVAARLAGRPIRRVGVARAVRDSMPQRFSASTVIGSGWRLTRSLRGYFEGVHGPGFRFNAALRAFIAAGEGRALGEASDCYRRSLVAGTGPIAAQFEYNRHMRDFFRRNPGATRDEALASWWAQRAAPRR